MVKDGRRSLRFRRPDKRAGIATSRTPQVATQHRSIQNAGLCHDKTHFRERFIQNRRLCHAKTHFQGRFIQNRGLCQGEIRVLDRMPGSERNRLGRRVFDGYVPAGQKRVLEAASKMAETAALATPRSNPPCPDISGGFGYFLQESAVFPDTSPCFGYFFRKEAISPDTSGGFGYFPHRKVRQEAASQSISIGWRCHTFTNRHTSGFIAVDKAARGPGNYSSGRKRGLGRFLTLWLDVR